MAKTIDYTGETVKKSISETMKRIIAYHTRYWREGNELKVRDYIFMQVDEELDKYLSYSKKEELISPLCSYAENPTSNKYTKIFERWLLQYGPYILTLAMEYASARVWKNRYLVTDERKKQLIDEDFHRAMKSLKNMKWV